MEIAKVILDTSVIMNDKFDFTFQKYKHLLELHKEGIIDVVLPDVIRRECWANFQSIQDEYKKVIDRLKRNTKRYYNIHPFDKINKFNIDTEKALKEFKDCIEKYFDELQTWESTKENILPNVFDAYFNKEPPFSEKKKDEFPDAVVLMSLANSFPGNEIILLSLDPDWKNFADHNSWRSFLNVEEFLNSRFIISKEELDLIEEHIPLIWDSIKESVTPSLFEVGDECDAWDASEEVLEVEEKELDDYKLLVIDRKGNENEKEIIVYFDASIIFNATFSVFDINESMHSLSEGYLTHEYFLHEAPQSCTIRFLLKLIIDVEEENIDVCEYEVQDKNVPIRIFHDVYAYDPRD